MEPSPDPGMQVCYRHPDRPAGVICQRCDRPICPQCMHQASVGFHCPECVKSGKQKVVHGPGIFQVAPVLTQVLIGINVAVFLVMSLLDQKMFGGDISNATIDFGLVANGVKLSAAGVPVEKIGVGNGELYRLVTSGFMHYGLLHLLLNCYALWILGQAVEQFGGRLRLGIVYGVAMLAGSLGALIASPEAVTVGASGAIFGLMGAITVALRARGVPWRNSPLLPTLMINLLITFGIPNISIGGHLGGLVGGAAAGWLLFDFGERPGVNKGIVYGLCGGLAVACVIAAAMVAGQARLVGIPI